MQRRAFTLVELLVVIAVLAILTAVAVFAVGGITDRGEEAACDASADADTRACTGASSPVPYEIRAWPVPKEPASARRPTASASVARPASSGPVRKGREAMDQL